MTMPSTNFNVPRGSFPTPIKPIGVGPLEGPQVSVHFNYKWCQVIVGSLSQLLLNTTWDVDNQDALTAIQEDVFDLMASFCVNPPAQGATPGAGAGGGDDFMLRQNPDNPCELQTSVDGVNWCTWADLSKCMPAPAQPGPGSPQPAPNGGCVTYHAVLPANGRWLVPTFVNAGDTIEVSNVQGVWSDGSGPWFCANGDHFVGVICLPTGGASSGDPDPTVNHMALIFHLSSGLYSPILAGPVTIPGGVVANTIEFLANDAVPTDNLGQIEFDVKICNNQAGSFTHHFDLRTSPGPFVVNTFGGTSNAAWAAGGYAASITHSAPTAGEGAIDLHLHASRVLNHVTLRVVGTCTDGSVDGQAVYQNVGTFPPQSVGEVHGANQTGAVDLSALFTASMQDMGFEIQSGTVMGQTATITDVYVSADGADPF